MACRTGESEPLIWKLPIAFVAGRVGAGDATRSYTMSIISKVGKFVKSLTSNEANTDVPPSAHVPPTEDGAVPMPDREPMAGFEPESKS